MKVLLVVTNHDQLGNTGKKTGWYLPEVAHPYHVFKAAGHDIVFVSPKGGKAPMVSQAVYLKLNSTFEIMCRGLCYVVYMLFNVANSPAM